MGTALNLVALAIGTLPFVAVGVFYVRNREPMTPEMKRTARVVWPIFIGCTVLGAVAVMVLLDRAGA